MKLIPIGNSVWNSDNIAMIDCTKDTILVLPNNCGSDAERVYDFESEEDAFKAFKKAVETWKGSIVK